MSEAVDLFDLATYAHGYLDAESKYRKMIEGGELVEVVRCKDCGNWDTDWNPNGGGHYCGVVDLTTSDEFYCAYGERRTDE